MRRAFTLFEVLVVLVIMGSVSMITLSMVSQLSRNLARFYPATEYYPRLELRIGWLSNTIASFVPSREKDGRFRGDQASIVGLATYFPGDAWPNEREIRLAILVQEGVTTLKADHLSADGSVQASLEVLRISCERARFFYLSKDMTWVNAWTQQAALPYLPLAIWFACDGGREPLHVITAIEREGHAIMGDHDVFGAGR